MNKGGTERRGGGKRGKTGNQYERKSNVRARGGGVRRERKNAKYFVIKKNRSNIRWLTRFSDFF